MPSRSQKAPVHGREHTPTGPDSIYTGEWVVVDSSLAIPGTGWWTETTPPVFVPRVAPDYLGGWGPIGSGYVPTRFRISIGPMNLVDRSGSLVEHYSEKQLEFQIAVDGGVAGTEIFAVPPEFLLDTESIIPLHSHDILGNYHAYHYRPDGFIVDGP